MSTKGFQDWFKKHLPKSYSKKQRDKVWDDICKKIKDDQQRAKKLYE